MAVTITSDLVEAYSLCPRRAFLLMTDTFEVSQLTGEARLVFEHATAQAHFGASIFWVRSSAALGGEQETMEHWQLKRDGGRRGIVEIVPESS